MNVVSFFAGCGGLDLGFEQAGFNAVWANELESHCQATYIRNHPNTKFVLDDVCKIDPDSIPDCGLNDAYKMIVNAVPTRLRTEIKVA